MNLVPKAINYFQKAMNSLAKGMNCLQQGINYLPEGIDYVPEAINCLSEAGLCLREGMNSPAAASRRRMRAGDLKSCSQNRSTRQPSRRSVRVTSRSRA